MKLKHVSLYIGNEKTTENLKIVVADQKLELKNIKISKYGTVYG